ncbi:MAG TPA: MFS transporter [Burkholderiales bacterium]|nr:MFS transporter [Burkholderiales bacterium]
MNGGKGPGAARVVAAVAMTLAVQSLTAMALAVPSVLAPVAAADFGAAPTAVGQWVGFSYMVAMFAGLASGTLVGRHGPVRVLQVAVLGVALGLAVGAGSHVALLLLCGAFLGTAHGLVNPASSAILAAAAPLRMRSMIFSIKQTGVPVGGAVAGMLVPVLLLWTSWQAAVLALALGAAAFLAVLVPFRRAYDPDRRPDQRLHVSGFAAPVAEVWARRPILELALVSSVYSAAQISFVTYLVSYLKIELAYSLVAAGLVFSASQFAGALGRVIWGAVADHVFEPRVVLAALGLVMALCGFAVALFTAGWPPVAVFAVCALYGVTAVGWNGVFLAEVARLAPEGRVAIVTGGTQFFTFAGVLIGPPLFGAIASATGSYGAGFVVIAALPLLASVGLLASRGRASAGRA